MQNADDVVSGFSRTALFAFCILHFVLLSCSKTSPTTSPASARTALDQLRREITQATQSPGVQRGVWGIVVHSLDRNERLFELQPRTLLVPASVAKLAVVATAAEAVGWDYQYETTLQATGPIVDGVLKGDLVIVGSGDPTVGGRAGFDQADPLTWAMGLRMGGLRRIEGRIIGDDDAIEEPRPQLAWAWDDLGYPSGALFGALNYQENRMTVSVTAGPAPGAPASIGVDRRKASRPIVSRVVTGAVGTQQLIWPEQRPGESFLTIAGSVPVGAQPAQLSIAVGNPTMWIASALRAYLQGEGVEVTGEAWDIDDAMPTPDRTQAQALITTRSRPLRDIVQALLKDSINLYAEAVMRLNAPPGQPRTNDAALEGFTKRLTAWGIPPSGQQQVDGSGLSRRDTISAETILAVLQRMHEPHHPSYELSPFVTALPIAGVDGTLSERMKKTPAEGNVRAKTGTMSNIRSLAGYVRTRDDETLAFVAMVNNFEGTGAVANAALDRIAVTLASFSRSR